MTRKEGRVAVRGGRGRGCGGVDICILEARARDKQQRHVCEKTATSTYIANQKDVAQVAHQSAEEKKNTIRRQKETKSCPKCVALPPIVVIEVAACILLQ
jgi:hypothetical protein